MPYDEAKHTTMVEKALDAIPGYPFLPCPLCGGVEGCDHTVVERATATRATPFPGDGKIILTSNPG